MEIIEIPQAEVNQLIKDELFHSLIKEAYQATMPNLMTKLELDPRFIKSTHYVNEGFNDNPIFLLAGHPDQPSNSYIVSTIYVFPKYRNKGISKNIFRFLADQIPENVTIQLAVEESKIPTLDPYYKSLGFKTTGVKVWDNLVGNLVDYFWCKCHIELNMMNNNKQVAVQRRGLRPSTEWELYQ